MYGYNPNDFSGDFLGHYPTVDATTEPVFPSYSALYTPNSVVIPNNDQFDSFSTLMKQEFCYTTTSNNTSSGCSSYGSPSSLTSYGTTQASSLMQRSVSSHSFEKNVNGFQFNQLPEFMDSDSGSVRKVFSTGDLEVYKHL